jgi:sugar O-acyltransferase (sialic acid O-acetyltransferase NeuD family)
MTQIKEVVILGGGGTTKDIISIIDDINAKRESLRCIGILDDNNALWDSELLGIKVIGPTSEASNVSCNFVNALGSPRNFRIRKTLVENLKLDANRFETIVHPTSSVSRYAMLGVGTVIFPNSVVMSDVEIGNQVLILPGSVINHDVKIGDYTILTSGVNVSGGITIGQNCYLGTGSSLIQQITVGDDVLIGMGSTVIQDVEDGGIIAGNPAKHLKSSK